MPNANFNGTDSFTYSITDVDGTTRIGTVTLSINAVNDLPIVIRQAIPEAWQETTDDVFRWNLLDAESVELSLGALFGDTEEGALTLVAAGLPEGLLLDPATGVISGSLGSSVSSGGAANDGVYEVTLSVTDSEGATTTITLQIVVSNQAPIAEDDLIEVVGNRTTVMTTDSWLLNDRDPDGDSFVWDSIEVLPEHGRLEYLSGGLVAYTPTAGFVGADSLLYRIVDQDGSYAIAKVQINVLAESGAPIGKPDHYVLTEDSDEVELDLTANDDLRVGLNFQLEIVEQPAFGFLSVLDSNQVSYKPFDDLSGQDQFVYRLIDSEGFVSNDVSVSITILAGPKNHIQNQGTPQIVYQNLEGEPAILSFLPTNPTPNGISVSDADSEILSIRLSVEHGILSMPNIDGLIFEGGIHSNAVSLALEGPITALNLALAGLTYSPDLYYLGPDHLSILTQDEGGPDDLPARYDEDSDGLAILVELSALGGRRNTNLRGLIGQLGVEVASIDLIGYDEAIIDAVQVGNSQGDPLSITFQPKPGQDGGIKPTSIELKVNYLNGNSQIIQVPVSVFQPHLILIQDIEQTAFKSPNLNPQTGFFEQSFEILNETPFDFATVRIYLIGLDEGVKLKYQVFEDLVGSYIDIPTYLQPGERVSVMLEYFSSTGRAFSPPQLKLLVTEETIEDVLPISPAVQVEKMNCFASIGSNGRLDSCYVTFATELGAEYLIQYSDDLSIWHTAMGSVFGTGGMMIWQDRGLPLTDPLPQDSNAGRYYRLLKFNSGQRE